MAEEQINTTLPAATESQIANNDGNSWNERAIEVTYDFHASKDETPADTFTPEVVNHFFYKSAKVFIQQKVRSWLRQGKSDADIKKLVTEIKLSVTSGTRVSASEKIMREFNKLSREQVIAILKEAKDGVLAKDDASAQ